MVKAWRSHSLVSIICGLLLAGSPGVGAAGTTQTTVPQRVNLDIPAQPLASALYAYSAATAIQVAADGALVSGRQSAELRGAFAPEDALRDLLAGTGLTVRRTAADAFVLVPVRTEEVSAGPAELAPMPDYIDYSAVIQAAMKRTLCRLGTTEPGAYRMAVQLWIAPSGTVTETNLLGSSGNNARDAALSTMLHNLAVGAPPPAGLPQPVTVLILPRSPVATGDCSPANSP
ncbi:hypothetical protein GCM10011611_67620 [Aliidongia dinghuensis]|uniref:Secretin/TonB short N-terminal domain-containing protein n=1 Tax=Aliidongia dinghuensis TaxID=1867774 RepID=A0A8J2Z1P4_9PROT|nr:secretin and TonB N-terminal domain-containing protein [Aliidongia dinghuensis]GGF51590.1 hypothetical protein GCM10011611_67620 [Aliidongia dinghuensis]